MDNHTCCTFGLVGSLEDRGYHKRGSNHQYIHIYHLLRHLCRQACTQVGTYTDYQYKIADSLSRQEFQPYPLH